MKGRQRLICEDFMSEKNLVVVPMVLEINMYNITRLRFLLLLSKPINSFCVKLFCFRGEILEPDFFWAPLNFAWVCIPLYRVVRGVLPLLSCLVSSVEGGCYRRNNECSRPDLVDVDSTPLGN